MPKLRRRGKEYEKNKRPQQADNRRRQPVAYGTIRIRQSTVIVAVPVEKANRPERGDEEREGQEDM
jgi:hypothetical protein